MYVYDKYDHCFPSQNGLYGPKNDCESEKWSRKIIFEIPSCAKPFSENLFYFIERWIFAQNHQCSNNNDPLCAWRDFKKIFLVDGEIK